MKKLFLFTCLSALALSLNGCSGDDDNSSDTAPSGTVSFTIGGVTKTYNTVTVNEESETYDGETYEWITITASENGTSSEYVQFGLTEGMLGADALDYFEYVESNRTFALGYNSFNLNTLTNNADKIRGTFSGAVYYWSNDSQQSVARTITEGSFDINR